MRVLASFTIGLATAAAMPIPNTAHVQPRPPPRPPTYHYQAPVVSDGAETTENPSVSALVSGLAAYAVAGLGVWSGQRAIRLAVRRKRIANCVQEMRKEVPADRRDTAASSRELETICQYRVEQGLWPPTDADGEAEEDEPGAVTGATPPPNTSPLSDPDRRQRRVNEESPENLSLRFSFPRVPNARQVLSTAGTSMASVAKSATPSLHAATLQVSKMPKLVPLVA